MLASIVLLTYNQPRYLAEALRSAFAQTYRPLEIIISDDCGTDGTWEAVQTLAAECPSDIRLILRRNSQNLGTAANMAAAVAASAGEIIFGWAHDDISEPHRVVRTMEAFSGSNVIAVGVACDFIDEEGRLLPGLYEPMPSTATSLAITGDVGGNGASAAYRRVVFEKFAPLPAGLLQEDIVLYFRAALLGDIAVINTPLVHYRRHSASIMGGANGRGSRQAFTNQQRRFARNETLVRLQQIADLKNSGHQALTPHLKRHLRIKQLAESASNRHLSVIPRSAAALASRELTLRELAKLLLSFGAPGLWYDWVNRRHFVR